MNSFKECQAFHYTSIAAQYLPHLQICKFVVYNLSKEPPNPLWSPFILRGIWTNNIHYCLWFYLSGCDSFWLMQSLWANKTSSSCHLTLWINRVKASNPNTLLCKRLVTHTTLNPHTDPWLLRIKTTTKKCLSALNVTFSIVPFDSLREKVSYWFKSHKDWMRTERRDSPHYYNS